MEELKEEINELATRLKSLSEKLNNFYGRKYDRFEIAEMLNVNPMTIYRHMKAGILKAELIGKSLKSTIKDIEEYRSKF